MKPTTQEKTMEHQIETRVSGMKFLESPHWHEGALYVADFFLGAVFRIDTKDAVTEYASVPTGAGGIGWLPDGRLLVVSLADKKILRREPDGTMVEHADVAALMPGAANDMVVSASGVAYVGNHGFDILAGEPVTTATLVKVSPDGSATTTGSPLAFPNGAVITSEGALVIAETFGNRISAFDIGDDGELGERRDWAVFGEMIVASGLPEIMAQSVVGADGICMDADGALWVADCYHNRVLRVAEGGQVLDEISTGDLGVFAVALGGEDGRTLYMCAAPNALPDERAATELGVLLSVQVPTPAAGC